MLAQDIRYIDCVFEDVSNDILMTEDCLIVMEPYGSFPGRDFCKSTASCGTLAHHQTGGDSF